MVTWRSSRKSWRRGCSLCVRRRLKCWGRIVTLTCNLLKNFRRAWKRSLLLAWMQSSKTCTRFSTKSLPTRATTRSWRLTTRSVASRTRWMSCTLWRHSNQSSSQVWCHLSLNHHRMTLLARSWPPSFPLDQEGTSSNLWEGRTAPATWKTCQKWGESTERWNMWFPPMPSCWAPPCLAHSQAYL